MPGTVEPSFAYRSRQAFPAAVRQRMCYEVRTKLASIRRSVQWGNHQSYRRSVHRRPLDRVSGLCYTIPYSTIIHYALLCPAAPNRSIHRVTLGAFHLCLRKGGYEHSCWSELARLGTRWNNLRSNEADNPHFGGNTQTSIYHQ